MQEVDGHASGAGRVVAAELTNKGRTYRAFLWRGADGAAYYYAEDGKSLRKAFLRSPLAFTRVTSGYSLARLHPFMQTWRAHKGVDFAALNANARCARRRRKVRSSPDKTATATSSSRSMRAYSTV
jgi:murein DD-endopeptidase MepM/ murein hydrolase activator NlpD